MATDCWLFHVDVAGSSERGFTAPEFSRIYAIAEECFRFCLATADIAWSKTSAPDGDLDRLMAWAGEGGFALIETEAISADELLLAAERFGRYIGHFLAPSNSGVSSLSNPLQFRILLSDVQPVVRPRLANYASRMLSVLLKHERDYGQKGFITLHRRAYDDLSEKAKQRAVARVAKIGKEKKEQTVYDVPILGETPDEILLVSTVLSSKNRIDESTAGWMNRMLYADVGRARTLEEAITSVFEPNELLYDILAQIHSALTAVFGHVTHQFRVAYLTPNDDGHLVVRLRAGFTARTGAARTLDLSRRFTACVAWNNETAEFVGDTKRESELAADVRRFEYSTQAQQMYLKSIACIPVIAPAHNEDAEAPELSAVSKRKLGVLSVDTSSTGFFAEVRAKTVNQCFEPFLSELAIATMFGTMMASFCPKTRSGKDKET